MVEAEILQKAAQAWLDDLKICRCGQKLSIKTEAFYDPYKKGPLGYRYVFCDRCGRLTNTINSNDDRWLKSTEILWGEWAGKNL